MRLCKERQAGREVPTAATVTPAMSPVAPVDVPMPKSLFGGRKAPPIPVAADGAGPADVDADLADAVGLLDVEGTPLGLDAPEMLVDVSPRAATPSRCNTHAATPTLPDTHATRPTLPYPRCRAHATEPTTYYAWRNC